MVILLQNGKAIAFSKYNHAEIEQEKDYVILKLKTSKNVKSIAATFNWNAVAGVMTDEDYAYTLGAEIIRDMK